jgi:hypothetical protein
VWTPGPDDVYLRAWFQGATYGNQYIHDRVAPAAAFAVADPALLPWVDGFAIDLDTATMSWSQTGTGSPDGAVIKLSWARTPGLWGVGNEFYYWTLILPPGEASRPLPALPAAFAVYAPTAADIVDGAVELLDSSAAGAGGLRELPEWRSYCADCTDLAEASYPRLTISSGNFGKGVAPAARPWRARAPRRVSGSTSR